MKKRPPETETDATPGEPTSSLRWLNLVALGAFALVAGLLALAWLLLDRQISEQRQREPEQAARQAALRLADYVTSRLTVVSSIAHERAHGLHQDKASFTGVALVQQEQFGGFQAINWIEPDGVIRWAVPEGPNRDAVGKSVFQHPAASPFARAARDTGEPQLTLPLVLFQGQRGLATYFPVSRGGELVGFVNGVFRTSDMVEASLRDGILDAYEIQVTDRGRLVHASERFEEAAVRQIADSEVDVAGHPWRIRLAPKIETWRDLSPTTHHLLLVLGVLLGAVLAAGVRTVLLQRLRGREAEKARLQLAELADSSLDIVVMVAPDGRPSYVSPSAGSVLGLLDPGAAVAGPGIDGLRRLVDPRDRDRIAGALDDIARTGRWEGSARFLHQATHEPIPLYARAFAIADPRTGKCVGFGCIAHDMREHERLQSDLRHAMKMEAVGRLAGGIAHDFNNLLTVVAGFADLIGMDESASGSIEGYVDELRKVARQGSDLTGNLLGYSRKSNHSPVRLDPVHVVRDMVQLLQRLVRDDIELTIESEDALGVVFIDRASLEQSIANLVVNASEAIAGKGAIRVSLSRRSRQGGDWVVISVRDTGAGMSQEEVERAFEPYYTTKGFGKGTGLGLSSVYGSVTSAGGYVEIASTPGEGALVEAWLPRLGGSAEAPASRRAPAHDATLLDGRTVLVVEDEPSLRAATAALLRRAGSRVLEANDGADAIEVLEARGSGHIDFLVSDVVMPRMGGLELVVELRRRGVSAPAVLCSGYRDSVVDAADAEALGCTFLDKPYDFAALVRALDSAARLGAVSTKAS